MDILQMLQAGMIIDVMESLGDYNGGGGAVKYRIPLEMTNLANRFSK